MLINISKVNIVGKFGTAPTGFGIKPRPTSNNNTKPNINPIIAAGLVNPYLKLITPVIINMVKNIMIANPKLSKPNNPDVKYKLKSVNKYFKLQEVSPKFST
jgi:hypothetical protein